jgi:hypothetical protein
MYAFCKASPWRLSSKYQVGVFRDRQRKVLALSLGHYLDQLRRNL